MCHEIFLGCGCFCAGVEMFSEESILCFQAAYVRAEAQYRTPLILCQVFKRTRSVLVFVAGGRR